MALAVFAATGPVNAGDVTDAPTIFTSKAEVFTELLDVPEVPRVDAHYVEQAQRISVNGARLHVQIAGEGPPLILLSGGPGNSLHSFHPYFAAAEAFATVIYYDRRGVGLSEWEPGPGYTVRQAIEDLAALQDRLGYEKVYLLGHSWGGFLTLAYADDYPEHVAGIILVGALTQMDGPDAMDGDRSRAYLTDEEYERIRAIYSSGNRIVAAHQDGLDLPELERKVFNAYRNGDWKRQYYYRPSVERMAQLARYEWVHGLNYNRDMARNTRTYNLTGHFLDRTLPVFIAEGKWDGAWGEGRAEAFRKEFPTAKIILYESSSHNPFRSEPTAFFADLRDFLADAAGR